MDRIEKRYPTGRYVRMFFFLLHLAAVASTGEQYKPLSGSKDIHVRSKDLFMGLTICNRIRKANSSRIRSMTNSKLEFVESHDPILLDKEMYHMRL